MKKYLTLLSVFLLGGTLIACVNTDSAQTDHEHELAIVDAEDEVDLDADELYWTHFFGIETDVFGDSNYGYFRLPENWVTFVDAGGMDDSLLQYSADGFNIITTQVLGEGVGAREFAETLLESLLVNASINDEIGHSHFGEFDAYFASVDFGDSYFSFFVFERPEHTVGNIQWFSIEGTPSTVVQIEDMLTHTFSLD